VYRPIVQASDEEAREASEF